MNQTDKLRLAFYEGSDGPRLVLFGTEVDASFAPVAELFRALARTSGAQVVLDVQPYIETHQVGLHLVSIGEGREGIGLRKLADCPQRFEWSLSPAQWLNLAELIDGLVSSNVACHQYLSSYPQDDATFVASKGEYDDSILEG